MRTKFLSALLLLFSFVVTSTAAFQPARASEELSLTFAIDASGSMRGEKIVQVRKSITTIVDNLEVPAQLSLITFASRTKVLIAGSRQKEELKVALENIRPAGNTTLYDGISTALQNTQNKKNSVLIIFSDGQDNASKSSVNLMREQVNQFAGLSIFIGLGKSANLSERLSYIAGSRGKVASVDDINNLTETLNSLVKPVIASSLQVQKISASEGSGDYRPLLALFLLAVAILLITSWILIRATMMRRANLELIKAYDTDKDTVTEKSIYFRLLRIPFVANYAKREEKRLIAAGLTINVRTWLYAQIGIFLGIAFFLQTSGFSSFLAFLLAGSAGFGIGTIYLNVVRSRKAAAFADELPDTLTIIASSLQSGLSFTQAITSVARESEGEVALQFRRVLAEVQVGRNLIDSLQDVADRMDSQDFRWTISALTIQREIGGNLSDILTTTAEAIRGRTEIRNEIRALSAEGRVSAYVLIALPLLMLLYIRITKPDSFNLMFSTTPGIVMMSIVAILMVVGWIWVQKVVNIKLT